MLTPHGALTSLGPWVGAPSLARDSGLVFQDVAKVMLFPSLFWGFSRDEFIPGTQLSSSFALPLTPLVLMLPGAPLNPSLSLSLTAASSPHPHTHATHPALPLCSPQACHLLF